MTLKLYKADMSPPARAVMMVLDILKLPFEGIDINLRNKEHFTPEFLKKNPLHTIPLLEDGDIILQDSHAIIMYLMDKYATDDALYPKDVVKRAFVNQQLFFDTCYIYFKLKGIAVAAFYEGKKSITENQRDGIIEAYGFLEQFLSKTKFLAGDQLTIADISAMTYVTSIAHFIPIDPKKFPLTDAWVKYLEKQPYAEKYNRSGALELANSINTSFENN